VGASAPAAANGQGVPDGVYSIVNLEPGSGHESVLLNTALAVELTQGKARIVSGCLPYGDATYDAQADGAWTFAQSSLSTKGCPGAAASDASQVLAAFTAGTSWRYEIADPAVGRSARYLVVGPAWNVVLVPGSTNGYTADTVRTQPPDDLSIVPGLQGSWRVESVSPAPYAPASTAPGGPYPWLASIDATRITLPWGCNTGDGDAYLATASGAFIMHSAEVFTLIGCQGERTESEDVFHALARVTRWESPSTDVLLLTGPSTELRLERAASTNKAFTITALRPATKTVRIAIGQTARLALSAEAIAPEATGKATVRWTNSRGAVAEVTTGAGTKKAAKKGSIAVPFNSDAQVRVKITGAKKGTSRLTFTAPSGVKTSVKIVVVARAVAPTKIAITGSNAKWSDSGQLALRATIRPANATGAVPQWSSSKPQIVRVDARGRLTIVPSDTPRASGQKVTITVKVGGKQAKKTLTLP
jgi:hypothetical protein